MFAANKTYEIIEKGVYMRGPEDPVYLPPGTQLVCTHVDRNGDPSWRLAKGKTPNGYWVDAPPTVFSEIGS